MANQETNGKEGQQILEEETDAFKVDGETREELGALKADHEELRKVREELVELRRALADEKIQKMGEKLDDLETSHRDTVQQFIVQRTKVDIWNKIQQVIVPILTALVMALASWVWNSQGKLEANQMKVDALSGALDEVKNDLETKTRDRYGRVPAQADHEKLEQRIYTVLSAAGVLSLSPQGRE